MEPLFDATAPLPTYAQASLSLQQAGVDATLAGNEIAPGVGITQASRGAPGRPRPSRGGGAFAT